MKLINKDILTSAPAIFVLKLNSSEKGINVKPTGKMTQIIIIFLKRDGDKIK